MKKSNFFKRVFLVVLFLFSSVSFAFTQKEEAILSKLKAALVEEPFHNESFQVLLSNIFSTESDQFLGLVLTVLKEHGKIDLINSKDPLGELLLFYPVGASRSNAVRMLLMFGADRFATSASGATLLHLAASHSSNEILRILLEEAFPDGKDKKEYVNSAEGEMLLTPLHVAASVGSKESVEILIKNGADLNLRSRSTGSHQNLMTAADLALDRGHVDLATDLVMRNPTINPMIQLRYMIEGGWHTDAGDQAFAALIARNSRWRRELTQKDFLNLLEMTIIHDRFNKFKILLDAGAPITITEVDPGVFTSTLFLVVKNNYPRYFDALVEHSADVLSRDVESLRTSLITALQDGKLEFAARILNLMSDSTLKTDNRANYAISQFVESENQEAVKFLIEKLGERSLIDLNFKIKHGGPQQGMTALALACQLGNLNLASQLLNAGADPNLDLGSKKGPTALFFAARSQNVDLIKLLLDRGAKSDVTNSSGKTVHEFAKEKRLMKSLDYLNQRFLSLNQLLVVSPDRPLRDSLLEIITDMDEKRRIAVNQYEPNLIHESFPLWQELLEDVTQSEKAWTELMSLRIRFKEVQSKIGLAEGLFSRILPSHPDFKESKERIQKWRAQVASQSLDPLAVATDPVVIDEAESPPVAFGAGGSARSDFDRPLEVASVDLSLLKRLFDSNSEYNRLKIREIEALMNFEAKEELEKSEVLKNKLSRFADEYNDPVLDKKSTQSTLRKILKSRGNSFTLALLKLLASNRSEVKLKKLFNSKEFELHRF